MTLQDQYRAYQHSPHNFCTGTNTNIKGFKNAVDGYDEVLGKITKMHLGPKAFKLLTNALQRDIFPKPDFI